MLAAKVKHLLSLLDATDERAGEGLATKDETEGGDLVGLGGGANDDVFAVQPELPEEEAVLGGILLLHEILGSAGKAGGTLIVGAKERFARSKGLAAQATPIGFPKGVREGVRVDTCGIPKQEAVDTLVIVAGRTGKG